MKTNNQTLRVTSVVLLAICMLIGLSYGQAFAPAVASSKHLSALDTRHSSLVTSAVVVNAASYEQQVAPGSIAALFGSNLTTQPGVGAPAIPLPTSLAGLSVKVNGVVSPLFYASAGQINLQIPGATAVGTATVEVFSGTATTPIASGTVTVADSAPGVFTLNSTGKEQAAALNSDSSINANFDQLPGSHPELTENYVTIYATGVGSTAPIVPDGQGAPGGTLAVATSTTTVTIGGVSGQVLFSGLAPGFVGLWQINVVLPGSLPTNFTTPFSVELRSKVSPATTLAVAKRSEYGNTTGSVVSAISGAPIAGAVVTLQPSASGSIRNATTDASGTFTVNIIAAGNYSLTAAATGFITANQNTTITGAQTELLPPIPLTAPLAAGEYRIVVAWKPVPLDLDGHLTGPAAGGSRFHVWWNGETDGTSPTARLDRDDLTGIGPETITVTPGAGNTYRFSVHNYTDRDFSGNTRLFDSRAIVRVFRGSQQIAVVSAPGGSGTLWKVFELIGNQLTIVNQLSDELEPSNIKASY